MQLKSDPSSHAPVEAATEKNISPLRYWLGMIPAMCLPLLAALFYFDWMAESTFARIVYGGTKVFTLCWPLLCFWLLWRVPLPKIRWKPERPVQVFIWGLLSGLAICAVMAIGMRTPLGDGVREGTANILAKTKSFGVLDHYWLFGAYVAIIHSLIEEYYWRWFVFGRLHERVRPWIAYSVAAIAFSAHHVVILSQYFNWPLTILFSVSVGIGGLLWSWLLVKQRTLYGAWLSHGLVDLAIFVIGYQLIF